MGDFEARCLIATITSVCLRIWKVLFLGNGLRVVISHDELRILVLKLILFLYFLKALDSYFCFGPIVFWSILLVIPDFKFIKAFMLVLRKYWSLSLQIILWIFRSVGVLSRQKLSRWLTSHLRWCSLEYIDCQCHFWSLRHLNHLKVFISILAIYCLLAQPLILHRYFLVLAWSFSIFAHFRFGTPNWLRRLIKILLIGLWLMNLHFLHNQTKVFRF